MSYTTADIAERTGLSVNQVRDILRAYEALKHKGVYRYGQRLECRQELFDELFRPIEIEREQERLADAQRMLVEAKAVAEQRHHEAQLRTMQAQARLEAARNAARARRDAFNKQPFKVRRPAAFRLAATPEVRSLREATLLVLAAGDQDGDE